MGTPSWKQFVEDLIARNHKSPYLDRLQSRLGNVQTQAGLEAELLQEMASALGHSEEKVNLALLKLEVLGQAVAAAEAPHSGCSVADVNERVAAFNAQREEAERKLYELRVHREAIGFRRHDGLDRLYPIPPRMKKRGGGGA